MLLGVGLDSVHAHIYMFLSGADLHGVCTNAFLIAGLIVACVVALCKWDAAL